MKNSEQILKEYVDIAEAIENIEWLKNIR